MGDLWDHLHLHSFKCRYIRSNTSNKEGKVWCTLEETNYSLMILAIDEISLGRDVESKFYPLSLFLSRQKQFWENYGKMTWMIPGLLRRRNIVDSHSFERDWSGWMFKAGNYRLTRYVQHMFLECVKSLGNGVQTFRFTQAMKPAGIRIFEWFMDSFFLCLEIVRTTWMFQ